MARTPWHLWVVGILALLWNAMGAWNYTATKLRLDAVMAHMTPEQLAFFEAIPTWATAAWAIAVWGSVLASIFLLMRSAWAVTLFWISFLAMAATSVQNFLLSEVSMSDIMGPGAAVFSGIIFLLAILLIWYSAAQKRAGRLR